MDKWKVFALVSMGFVFGILWTAAGGGASTAFARSGDFSVVVIPSASPIGESCVGGGNRDMEQRVMRRCCTDLGGTVKGWKGSRAALPICLY